MRGEERQDGPWEDGGREQGCDPKLRHARDCQQSWERGLEEVSPRVLDGVRPPGLLNQERISVVLSPQSPVIVTAAPGCSQTPPRPGWSHGGRQRQLLTSDTPPRPRPRTAGALAHLQALCRVLGVPAFLAAFASQPGWSGQCTRCRFLHYFGLFFFFL